jgi:hypothetical protein
VYPGDIIIPKNVFWYKIEPTKYFAKLRWFRQGLCLVRKALGYYFIWELEVAIVYVYNSDFQHYFSVKP